MDQSFSKAAARMAKPHIGAVAGQVFSVDYRHESMDESSREAVYMIVFTLLPGKDEAFLQALEPVLDAMRHEPTFRNAVLHRDPATPHRYMLYESWSDGKDVEHVQVHRDYRKAFWATLPERLQVAREVQVWQPMRGDFRFVD